MAIRKSSRVSTVRLKGQPKYIRGIGPSYRTGGPELAAKKAAAREARRTRVAGQDVREVAGVVTRTTVPVVCVDVFRTDRYAAWIMRSHPGYQGFEPEVTAEVALTEKALRAWFAERGWVVKRERKDEAGKALRFVPAEGATCLTIPAVPVAA